MRALILDSNMSSCETIRVQLCSDYLNGNCVHSSCSRLHLCKEFLVSGNKCQLTCQYNFSHDPLDYHNISIIIKKKLDHHSNAALIELLRMSFPRLCRDFNKMQCSSDQCKKLHLCVKENCGRKNCEKSHDIKDNHNMHVLKIYSLHKLKNMKILRSNLLISKNLEDILWENLDSACLLKSTQADISKIDVISTATSAVHNFLNGKYGVSLKVLQDAFPQIKNLKNVLENASSLFWIGKNSIDDWEVRGIGRIRLCFFYLYKTCRGNCGRLHLCKDYLLAKKFCESILCKYGFSHDIADEHNTMVMRDAGLTLHCGCLSHFSNLRASFPRLCTKFAETGSCVKLHCGYMHVCPEYVSGNCRTIADCKFSKKLELLKESTHNYDSRHNKALLNKFGFSVQKKDRQILLTNVLIPKLTDSLDYEILSCTSESLPGLSEMSTTYSKDETVKSMVKGLSAITCEESSFVRGSLVDRKIGTSEQKKTLFRQSIDKTEATIIQAILRDSSECFVKLASELIKAELKTEKNSKKWFEKRKDVFRLRSDTSSIKYVHLCIDEIKPCPNYWEDKCSSSKCEMFHICKEYIFDSIHNKRKCAFNHDFKDSHKARVISNLVFKFLTEMDLKLLLKTRYPVVCTGYQYNSCPDGEPFCSSFHVCYDYMAGQCKNKDSTCKWKHESAFTGNQAHRLMEEFHLNSEEFKSCIILPKIITKHETFTSDKDNFNCWREEAICYKSITSGCKYGASCHLLHPKDKLPYLWQYRKVCDETLKTEVVEWISLSNDINEKVEKEFCDPLQLKWTGVDTPSWVSSKFLQKYGYSCCNDSSEYIELRRLSTKSSALTTEQHVGLTDWRWYWNEGPSKWSEYTLGTHSKEIEIVYQELGNALFHFNANDFNYTISLDTMTQASQDPSYSTRDVRRRPVFKSKVEITPGLKLFPNVKGHWFKRTVGSKFTIMYSVYENIKRHFHSTVGRSVLVLDIKEIGCGEHYQVFQRKKQRFAEKSMEPNEMMLYHGADHSVVDSICADNFDYRLYAKNATLYGNGSYFSTTASISHNFTVEDDLNQRYMFVASVLTGKPTIGTEKMLLPSLLPTSKTERYDSCVDNISKPKIYVIFYKDQYYPRYLITYKTTEFVNAMDRVVAKLSVNAAKNHETSVGTAGDKAPLLQ